MDGTAVGLDEAGKFVGLLDGATVGLGILLILQAPSLVQRYVSFGFAVASVAE